MKNVKMQIEGAPLSAPFLEVIMADSFMERLTGLMFQKKLPQGTGLLLAPCNSVHMCFMRFAIDVIYVDENFTVLKVVKDLKPWTGLSICRKAWATLEMAAGEAKRCELVSGKKLYVVEKKK